MLSFKNRVQGMVGIAGVLALVTGTRGAPPGTSATNPSGGNGTIGAAGRVTNPEVWDDPELDDPAEDAALLGGDLALYDVAPCDERNGLIDVDDIVGMLDAFVGTYACTVLGEAGLWVASGTNIYNSNAGNVGIGTTTPTARLVVNSDTALTGNNTALFSAPLIGPITSHIHYGVTGRWYIRSASSSGDVIIQDTGGNVGIGTDLPNSKLHVAANDPDLILQDTGSASTQYGQIGYRNNVGTQTAAVGFILPGVQHFYITNSRSGGDIVLSPSAGGAVSVPVLEITGADLAEKFPTSDQVEPGMVVAIDPNSAGKLCLARGAYNPRVAGVVSGANDFPAGAVLGNAPGQEDSPPIALSGRVYVWGDASSGAIEPGDLLTTSDTPGHAMKAADRERSHGAVIGKAMTALAGGQRGLVLVLVRPQ